MHRMNRIREAEMRERVPEQKIAEIVRHGGEGNRMMLQETEPHHERKGQQQNDGKSRPVRNLTERTFERGAAKNPADHYQRDGRDQEIRKCEAKWILQGQKESHHAEQVHCEILLSALGSACRAVVRAMLCSLPKALRMRVRYFLALGVTALGALAFQQPFRQYHGVEYDEFDTPPDYQQPGEF